MRRLSSVDFSTRHEIPMGPILNRDCAGRECPYHLGYVSQLTDRMYPTGNLFKCTLLFPQATFDKTALFGSQTRPQNPLVSSNVLPPNEMLERIALQQHRSPSRRQIEFANATLFF